MGAGLFRKNLAWLKRYNQALYRKMKKVEPRNTFLVRNNRGEYNLIKAVGGVQYPLYSNYDVAEQCSFWVKETRRAIAGKKFIVLFGMGLGYELDALLQDEQLPAMVIVEPDEEVFYYLLHFFDLSQVEKCSVYFIQDDRQEEIEKLLSEVIKQEQSINFSFCPLAGYVYPFREQIQKLKQAIKEKINFVLVSVVTTLAHDRQWFQNYILNLKQVAGSVPVEKFAGELAGTPAVLVGAGPSLEYDIDVLREMGGRALIVPVGSAFSILEHHGIKGHAVGAIDGSYAEAKIFERNKHNREIALFYSLMVNYKVLPLFGESKFFFALHSFDEYIYRRLGQPFVKIAAGASVSISLLDILAKLGCNPIVMTGQDFCYPDKKKYARGAIYFGEVDEEALQARGGIKTKNKVGQDVYTTRAMLAMRAAVERIIESYPEITFYNCSRLGLPIRGAADATLAEVKERFLTGKCELEQRIREIHRKYKDEVVTPEKVAAIEKDIQEQVGQIKELCGDIIRVLDDADGKDARKLLERIKKPEEKLAGFDFYAQVLCPETGMYSFLFSNLGSGVQGEEKDLDTLLEAKKRYYAKVYELCLIVLNALEYGDEEIRLVYGKRG
ncbi:hypothetical protein J2Z49_000728 [Desulfofundulus luciae]|uniref:DUF115 domain-containing protein n=1 Tax=Desulfofundulus luciae TaxID=74702 RepID=A0ABU0B007_9FIRM|nr:6-hydroxymethylpterin diphosphokinase MptE-like protein [Desulfofundulus luciae]MDQ0285624.1 hypothetical protein [Desulfofundulus luciae]